MKYHKRFGHFKATVVDATNELVVARPWRLSHEAKVEAAQRWLEKVSEAYGVPTPELVLCEDEMDMELLVITMQQGGGAYNGNDNVVRLSHFSVVTLLHEFRHCMQINGTMPLLVGERGQLVDEVTGEIAEAQIVEEDGERVLLVDPGDSPLEQLANVMAASRLVPAEEIDARAWSISLFAKVAPRRFRRMVQAGRILFVDPADVAS